MDMQQTATVNHQGILPMEVIRRNNKELIRGADRAKNVTVSALRTAVMVAGALYNQRIVLQKIAAINETTNTIISSTSKMLKGQGSDIHRQAAEASVSIDVLKQSFEDVIGALNEISRYRQEALPRMRQTIDQFRELAEKGEAEFRKLESGGALAEGNTEEA